MSRRLLEELKEKELIPLCLASTIAEAEKIESVLDGADIDYTFEITPIVKKSVLSIIFGSVKEGVLFLVPSERYELCTSLLEKAGLSNLIVE